MTSRAQWAVMGLGLAAALSVAAPAEAAGNPVRKGTMRLGAERLANIGARVDDPETAFFMSLLTTLTSQGNILTLQYPRVGFDYFILDGLSIGGNAGLSYNSLGGGVFGLAVLPRIGYAFDLSRSIEFWPRGGIGLQFTDVGGSNSSAVLTLEGMFLIEMVPHALFEFGPFLDAGFANNWPIELGGTAGLAIEF